MAHAAAAYYGSGFRDSAILVVDGAGDHYNDGQSNTVSIGQATNNQITMVQTMWGIERLYEDYLGTRAKKYAYLTKEFAAKSHMDKLTLTDNSFGDFYSLITYMCGFNLLEEGKTMGLAPYGKPKYADLLSQHIIVKSRGNKIDIKIDILKIYHCLIKIIEDNKKEYQSDILKVKADIASSGQFILEECLIKIMNHLYDLTGLPNLCYGGGVALNSVLNGTIKKRTKFKEVNIYPAAGDSGLAYGAAIYAYYLYHSKASLCFKTHHSFLGQNYSNREIEKTLSTYNSYITWNYYDERDIYDKAAQYLAENKIVGWFTGGAEFGPRALGHRSILTSPIPADMQYKLNKRVKFRESFRPFAPAVLREEVHQYFETDFEDNPFMLFVAKVKPEYTDKLAAITHVDETARVQTVDYKYNGKFYNLIKAFKKITEIPVLLNTSFNIKSMPIVETPEDAIKSFLQADIDYLFIENYLIKKCNTINNY